MIARLRKLLFSVCVVTGIAHAQGFHPGDAVRVNDETVSNQRFQGFYTEYRDSKGVAVGARGDQLDLLTRLTRGESAYVKNLSKILEMQHLQIEGKHNEALAIFDAFPEELKRDKNLLLMRFNIAAQADDKAYQAAMVDLKKSLPDDPALDFALIDHYFYAKQFDKALEIIDSIDKRVEGDPYLDFFRANIFYSDGNWAGAKRFAKQAIDREPDLEDPYWTLITISLDERDYAETARLLIAVEDSLGLVIGDLIDIPEYAGFRASEPYRRWLLRD